MTQVTLSQILRDREDRVRIQQEFLQEHSCPLLCFTMNIAGPIKNTPLIQRGFRHGLEALARQIPENAIKKRYISSDVTGNTAIFSVQMDATVLKSICTEIEERTAIGRLFDMDVLDSNGQKLERSNIRGCLVCGAPGRACAASRAHTVEALQHVTNQILVDHFAEADRKCIAEFAVQSLIDEVNTTPKPGLVDRNNNGSHMDMTHSHFIASANALKDYFAECVKIGQKTAQLTPQDTFLSLRKAGLQAEQDMYRATGGVNTHKGLIYTMGILCGSIGRLWAPTAPIASVSAICRESAEITAQSANAALSSAAGKTAGEKAYLQHGLKGIRGEIAAGLPSITELSLPCYQKALLDGFSQNDAGVITLLHLIANVEDTNLYHRGGTAGAAWAKQSASELLENGKLRNCQVELLDQAFIERNLSPGGCADLLAVTYFLHRIHNQ